MLTTKGWLGLGCILLGLFWIYYTYIFMRNPKRTTPKGNNIVAPANGKINAIVRTKKSDQTINKGILGKILLQTGDVAKDCYYINIVMTPLNIHYQRGPYDGTVLYVKHTKGKFLNAVSGASSLNATLENEHTETLIKTKLGKIKVVQIAGFLCRRIFPFVKKGQKIKKGQDLGIIKLGSQVTLVIPAKLKLKVKEGETMVDGETIIATVK